MPAGLVGQAAGTPVPAIFRVSEVYRRTNGARLMHVKAGARAAAASGRWRWGSSAEITAPKESEKATIWGVAPQKWAQWHSAALAKEPQVLIFAAFGWLVRIVHAPFSSFLAGVVRNVFQKGACRASWAVYASLFRPRTSPSRPRGQETCL